MSTSQNPQLKAATKRFIAMCLAQHNASPQELLAQSQQEWKKLRRESGLEKALQISTPNREYIARKDGTVEFLRK